MEKRVDGERSTLGQTNPEQFKTPAPVRVVRAPCRYAHRGNSLRAHLITRC